MSVDQALFALNNTKDGLSRLARNIVDALDDNRVNVFEGFSIATSAFSVGQFIVHVLQSIDDETRRDALMILEHGRFEYDSGGVVLPGDDAALTAINSVKGALAQFARAIVSALADGKVSLFEGVGIGFRAVTMGQLFISILQAVDGPTRHRLLHILEVGHFAPDGLPGPPA